MNPLASMPWRYTNLFAMTHPTDNPNPATATPKTYAEMSHNERQKYQNETPLSEWTMEMLTMAMPSRGYGYISEDANMCNTEAHYNRWFNLMGVSDAQFNALNDKQRMDVYDDKRDGLLRTVIKMRPADIRTRPATLSHIEVNRVRECIDADKMATAMSDSIVKAMVHATQNAVTLDDVRRIVRDELPLASMKGGKPRVIKIQQGDEEARVIEGIVHKKFDRVLKMCTRDNVMLVGGAGSGKTTIARQVAGALKLPFYFTGAIPHEAKLLGFINPHGKYVETAFYRAWTTGGVFLMDEVDASDPQAMLSINAALDNGICDFPNGMVEKHKDFHFIGAANTFGKGATMDYIGRNAQDEAGRSRWFYIHIEYDEVMEETIAQQFAPEEITLGWCKYIRAVRKAVETLSERHIVSPRSTIKGARALAIGIPRDEVEDAVLWHQMDGERKRRILEEAKKLCGGLLP
jgi:hypothetical protein